MKKGNSLIGAILAIVAIFGLFMLFGAMSGTTPADNGVPVVEAISLPEASNYAVDDAGVLTVEQILNLNKSLKAIDDAGGAQIAVLLVETTGRYSIEQYGIKLAEKWKVGDENLDNGIIVIVATKDRKVRIEVGHGMEHIITDSGAGKIIDDYMIPSLKKGDWYGAVVGAIEGIGKKVNN